MKPGLLKGMLIALAIELAAGSLIVCCNAVKKPVTSKHAKDINAPKSQ